MATALARYGSTRDKRSRRPSRIPGTASRLRSQCWPRCFWKPVGPGGASAGSVKGRLVPVVVIASDGSHPDV